MVTENILTLVLVLILVAGIVADGRAPLGQEKWLIKAGV